MPRSYIGELLCRQMEAPDGEWHLGSTRDPWARFWICARARVASPSSPPSRFPMPRSTPATSRRTPSPLPRATWATTAWRSASRSRGPTCSPRIAGRSYDLILANPPYVDAEALAAFPPEYAAEPALAHAGGADGLDLVRRILAEAGEHLSPDRHACGRDRARPDLLEQRVSGAAVPVAGHGRERGRSVCARGSRPALIAAAGVRCSLASPALLAWVLASPESSEIHGRTADPFQSAAATPPVEGPYLLEEVRACQPQPRRPAGGPAPRRDADGPALPAQPFRRALRGGTTDGRWR